MERVQRKATKIIPEIRNRSYQQWLNNLELNSLLQRRLRGKLIDVFKYLNRFNNVVVVSFTTASMMRLEIMEKNHSESIQYISSTTFLPHQYYNKLGCSILRCCQQ